MQYIYTCKHIYTYVYVSARLHLFLSCVRVLGSKWVWNRSAILERKSCIFVSPFQVPDDWRTFEYFLTTFSWLRIPLGHATEGCFKVETRLDLGPKATPSIDVAVLLELKGMARLFAVYTPARAGFTGGIDFLTRDKWIYIR